MTSEATVPSRASWKWSKTTETQKALLDVALEVFVEHGFAGASIQDIVDGAGSSVGSIYHHFGDKSGLYLALWESWMNSQEKYAAKAVSAARRSGEGRAVALFAAGARGYIEGAWRTRATGSLFFDKDGPPGFDTMRRTRHLEWLRQNALLLDTPDDPIGRVTVAVLTSVVGEASREVMASRTRREAYKIIDVAMSMIERLGLHSVSPNRPGA